MSYWFSDILLSGISYSKIFDKDVSKKHINQKVLSKSIKSDRQLPIFSAAGRSGCSALKM